MVIDFQGKLRARVIGNIQGLTVRSSDKMKISLEYRKEKIGVWEIHIIQVDGPQMTMSPGSGAIPEDRAVKSKPLVKSKPKRRLIGLKRPPAKK